LGALVRFVSNAVMTGFLNGVGVLIVLSQLSDLTGYQSSFLNRVAQALDLLLRFDQVKIEVVIIGAVALGLIVLLMRTPWSRFAFIVGIVVATVLLAVLSLPGLPTSGTFGDVPKVGDIAAMSNCLPSLVIPDPSLVLTLIIPAFSVAIIGLIQGAGVSQSTPNPDGKFPDVSRDFLGQGVANMATAFVSGLPAGGSVSGTALKLGSRAKSRMANIFGGLWVILIVLVAMPLVAMVPMAALAALLIVTGFQGLRIPDAVVAWQTGALTRRVMIFTFVATLIIPLQFAVLLGVVLSVVLHVFRQSNQVLVTRWVLQPGGFPVEEPVPKAVPSNELTILHVYGSLFFAAAKNLEAMLPGVDSTRHAVVAIILRGKVQIGSTFVNVLQRYAEALQARGGTLMLVGVEPSVRDQLSRTGALEILGEKNVFLATPQIGEALNKAVAAAEELLKEAPPSRHA
jgi:SulP family sulfate permease